MLDGVATTALDRTRNLHVGLLTLVVPGSVWTMHLTRAFGGSFLAAAPLWLGGLVECFVRGAPPVDTLKRVAVAVGKIALGWLCGFGVILSQVSD
eukprot:SAG22_NODE_2526_length_2475_cov_2.738215_2_plen_95_part_00